jgi:hypothetical protein
MGSQVASTRRYVRLFAAALALTFALVWPHAVPSRGQPKTSRSDAERATQIMLPDEDAASLITGWSVAAPSSQPIGRSPNADRKSRAGVGAMGFAHH